MPRDPYKPQVIVKNGKATAVVIDIDHYEAMLERLEQVEDLKAIRKLRAGDLQTVSFEAYLRRKDRRVSR